jgi:hypothetical protein
MRVRPGLQVVARAQAGCARGGSVLAVRNRRAAADWYRALSIKSNAITVAIVGSILVSLGALLVGVARPVALQQRLIAQRRRLGMLSD